jgi:hypothetical protein
LKDPKSKTDEDLRSSIESVLNGRPGERVSIDDYQFSNIQVKYAGDATGDLEPWKELEQEYDVVVDSNLTNKQTYNLRMNNKELENFRNSLQEKPVAERNFKIIRIVTEERQYMIEAASNPTPKANKRAIEAYERDTLGHALTHNIAAGYGAEGFSAGEKVIYDKEEWIVLDFVPFGEKISLVLIDNMHNNIVEFVPTDKVEKTTPEDPNDPTKDCDKKKKKKKAKKEPKKDLSFPESDIKTGETQDQKALKEEAEDSSRVAGVLVEFINKDPELNKNRFTPIVKNLQRKRREGSYDSNLAAKAFQVLVDEGASKYFNENDGKLLGDEFSSHNEMFPREVKTEVSEAFRDQFEANVEMGNFDEGINAKIASLVEEAESALNETMDKEAVPFTANEKSELNKIDGADISAENVATFNWDSGNQSFKVEITKKPRSATNDLVYSAVSTDPDDNIDEERTKDSESFNKQEDLTVLRDFLTSLNLNEDIKLEEVSFPVASIKRALKNIDDKQIRKIKETDHLVDVAQNIVKAVGAKGVTDILAVAMIVRDYVDGKRLNLGLDRIVDSIDLDDDMDEESKAESEGITDGDVHPEQLVMGIKVEMEHTESQEEAKKIALDHLAEFGDYYTRHAKMEKKAEKEHSEKKEEITEAYRPAEKGEFEFPLAQTTKGNFAWLGDKEVTISGSYTLSKGLPQTRLDPEEPPEFEWYDLKIDGKDFDIERLKPKDQDELDDAIQEYLATDVGESLHDRDAAAADHYYDMRKHGDLDEEKKEKSAPKKKDASKPTHTTTKMVNALPIRDGKKVRTEVKGDVRIRYKTFEEKRKEDKEKKSKKKGDK